MNILIIEHAIGRANNFIPFLTNTGAATVVWRSYQEARPKTGFDAIILTGGPKSVKDILSVNNEYFQDEVKLVKEAIRTGIPILGVCLGFQLLCHILGGKVIFSQPWIKGWIPQTLTQEGRKDPLFYKIPDRFTTFEYHQDKAIKLPSHATLLATAPHCPIEAFKIQGKPIWGIQFHPEISDMKAKEILGGSIDTSPETNPTTKNTIKREDRSYSPQIAQQIFTNFTNQVTE